MATLGHAKVSGKSDGSDASVIQPSDWNADHATTILNGDVFGTADHLVITSTDRLTAAGTGELRVLAQSTPFLGAYGLGTVTVGTDQFLLQYKRASLAGTARASLVNNAELFVFNLAPVSRLVLTGFGG